MARSQPITWRNVNVDNGASAAAFGNSAANFGRTAIQGLDVFSDQMQKRMDVEDERLTNEAIAAALSGGPAVSKNRRVDANALQTAVERNALGNRQERALEDDLLSSAVNRRLNSANAGIAEYNLETAPERWDFDKKMKEAELEMQQARAANDTARLKIAQRQITELDRVQKGREGFNSYLYGPEITGQADAEFDAKWAQNPNAANVSPQQKAELRKIAREQFRWRFIQDPNNLYTLGQRFNLQPLEVEQYTAVGRDSREAAVAGRQSLADIAAANAQEATKIRTAAEAVAGGDTSKILWDGSNWTYGSGGGKVNGAIKSDTMARLGLKEDDKKASAFSNAVQAAFPTGSAYRAAMEQLIGKFGKDGIPDEYRREIDSLSQAVRSQADRDSKIRAESFVAASTEDLINNFVDSITQALPPADSDPQETGQALSADPALTADYISQIPVSGFTSDQQVQDSRNQLETVVAGLQDQQKELKPGADASDEVKSLFNQYNAAVNVANGGSFLPIQFGLGVKEGQGDTARPMTPNFAQRKEHAEKATRLLQNLLNQMRLDGEAAAERSFQDQLNATR